MLFESKTLDAPDNSRKLTSEISMRIRSATNFQKNKIRVLVMGSSQVGKTSLIGQFISRKFVEDYGGKGSYCGDDKQKKIVVELMDTHQTLLPSLKRLAIKTSNAFVLVYSINDPESFEIVSALKDEIIEMKVDQTPIVVVGNKADLPERELDPIVTDCVVTIDWEIPHVEVSAKDGHDLCEIYRSLFRSPELKQLVDTSTDNPFYYFKRRMSLPPRERRKVQQSVAKIDGKNQPTTSFLIGFRTTNAKDTISSRVKACKAFLRRNEE